jgi:hypothetical protein
LSAACAGAPETRGAGQSAMFYLRYPPPTAA